MSFVNDVAHCLRTLKCVCVCACVLEYVTTSILKAQAMRDSNGTGIVNVHSNLF